MSRGYLNEAEDYAGYSGEGQYDDPPEPESDRLDAETLRIALQAIRQRRLQEASHARDGMLRAEHVIERLLEQVSAA